MHRFARRIGLPGGPGLTRLVLLVFLVVSALATAAACGRDGPAGLVSGSRDAGPLALEVETTPDSTVYDWDDSRARFLEVRDRDDGSVVWRIVAPAQEGFVPPVVHGRTPAGAEEEVSAGILRTGTRHDVVVEAMDGTRQTETFTP